MSISLTRFSPVEHGFRFPNYFQFKSGLTYSLPIFGILNLDNVVFGLCGGMCFAALDYFHASAARPATENVEKVERPLFLYMAQRQLDSIPVPTIIKIVDWMLAEPVTVARRMTRTELPRLLKHLAAGKPQVLCLIRARGLSDPTQNHQVLATGYELDEATQALKIHIYDPNHPNQRPWITVNQTQAGQHGWLTQSTAEPTPLHGFFIITYRAQKTFPRPAPVAAGGDGAGLGLGSESLTAGPVFALAWPTDSRQINQRFGEHPSSYRPFGLPGHEGLDLYAVHGAAIYACAPGIVYQVNHPKNHPYGLQVRIRHEAGGQAFHTIYAHLSEVCVEKGQTVAGGQLLGRADNSGNSFGAHLHLTLKIEGAQTPGYPAGIVDPLPYLKAEIADATVLAGVARPIELPPGAIFTTRDLNLRAEPNTQAAVLTILPAGELLIPLDGPAAALAAVGLPDQWLRVGTTGGQSGYVAAVYTAALAGQAYPPSGLVVYPTVELNLRSGPGVGFDSLGVLPVTAPLTVLGDEPTARARLGREGQWLQVLAGDGARGFVAAWLVHLTGQRPPDTGLVVTPLDVINIRARPDREANVLTTAQIGERLAVLGDPATALADLGREGRWLNVQSAGGPAGYAAAWYLRQAAEPGGIPTPSAPPDLTASAAGLAGELGGARLDVRAVARFGLRVTPAMGSVVIGYAQKGRRLSVVSPDLEAARADLGKEDCWLPVATAGGKRGWAPAWMVEAVG